MRGHVRKRGAKWAVVISLGYDAEKKRIQKWFGGFNTKKEAEQTLIAKLQEYNTGMFVENDKETVETYMALWLRDKEAQVRYNTFKKYRWLTTVHVIPNLGHLELTKLMPQHLQSLYTVLQTQEKPLSNRSILHLHNMVHEALERALKWNLVVRNVADAVDPPRPKNKEMETWSQNEVLKFLRVIDSERYATYFWLLVGTGMRRAEAAGLRWRDVDFENGRIQVRQSLVYAHGQPTFQELKTDKSRRIVSLPAQIVDKLRKHKAEQSRERLMLGPAYHDHDLVFAKLDGSPVAYSTIQRTWLRGIKSADVKRIRIHDLRHTHASMLFDQGIQTKVISERLGHARVNVTLDIYTHVNPEKQDDAARQFGDRLFGQSGAK